MPIFSREINIVFASDKNFILYTGVAVYSLLLNYKSKDILSIYILVDSSIEENIIERFRSMENKFNCSIYFIVVTSEIFSNIRTSEGISSATYFRMYIHVALPINCQRVIYLDSDIIVMDSIEKLFHMNMGDKLFMGVEDSISITYNNRFGIKKNAVNINAGVLLINLKRMREIEFTKIINAYLHINKYRIFLGDQQILCEIFHNKTGYLPLRWNVHGDMFNEEWAEGHIGIKNRMDRKELEQARRHPAIIHYTLRRKPWASYEHPRSKDWFFYFKRSPFCDLIYIKRTLKYHFLYKTGVSFLNKLVKKYEHGIKHSISVIKGLAASAGIKKISSGNDEYERMTIYHTLLRERNQNLTSTFDLKVFFDKRLENNPVFSNIKSRDIDGGYAENLKIAFKTSKIMYDPSCPSSCIVLISLSLKQNMFWVCLNDALQNNKDLLFIETALFGGYASSFDRSSCLAEQKFFGFMIDDMGFCYDAFSPSRLEQTLNSPHYSLTEENIVRTKQLIQTIIRKNITKYNKYFTKDNINYVIEEGSVVIIDQRKNNYSSNFFEMIQVAIEENKERHIYFKKHPDNILRESKLDKYINTQKIITLPEDISIDVIINKCSKIYTVSSQVGFEGLLRNKKVCCFGTPFYAGWGLTEDRIPIPRRKYKRSIEEIFYQACIAQSVYIDSSKGKIVEIEDAIDIIDRLRGIADNE